MRSSRLNAFFIPIRVEESQRPDVDLRYNQNGWPTIAFLTPAGDDILRVNYLDPEPFISLLVRLVDAYQRDKATILETAAHNRMEAQQRKVDAAPPLGALLWPRSLACWKGSLTRCTAATARKPNSCIRKPTISCSTSWRQRRQDVSRPCGVHPGEDARKPHLRPQRWRFLPLLVTLTGASRTRKTPRRSGRALTQLPLHLSSHRA